MKFIKNIANKATNMARSIAMGISNMITVSGTVFDDFYVGA